MLERAAAGVAMFDGEGRLLLGRHAHDGRWATIGGAVEPGEAPAHAARREVSEEVGLHLPELNALGEFGGTPHYEVEYPGDASVRYTVTMYAAVVLGADPRPDRQEILETGWFSPAQAARLVLAPDMVEIIPAAYAWSARQLE